MKQAVLSRMLEVSPVHLIVGNGVFGRALSRVMDAQMLSGDELESDQTESGTYPLVLDSLRVVLLVIEASQSLAQAISQHDQIWVWVKRLTTAAECHEIGIVFVPLDGMADSVESARRYARHSIVSMHGHGSVEAGEFPFTLADDVEHNGKGRLPIDATSPGQSAQASRAGKNG